MKPTRNQCVNYYFLSGKSCGTDETFFVKVTHSIPLFFAFGHSVIASKQKISLSMKNHDIFDNSKYQIMNQMVLSKYSITTSISFLLDFQQFFKYNALFLVSKCSSNQIDFLLSEIYQLMKHFKAITPFKIGNFALEMLLIVNYFS